MTCLLSCTRFFRIISRDTHHQSAHNIYHYKNGKYSKEGVKKS